jgi:quercetin dioxygenase-like cupin family protein
MQARRYVRRVVTGHDEHGQSCIVLDDAPPAAVLQENESPRIVTEVWASKGNSAPQATEIRIVEMPPQTRREMHRTDTIDYGIVLAGEIHLILERVETLLQCGDVVIQRGTNHAWDNRSQSFARLAFINISGQISDDDRCPPV